MEEHNGHLRQPIALSDLDGAILLLQDIGL